MGLGIELEIGFGYPSKRVVGVDEVGRGCLAGPVVAAAVMLPPDLAQDKNPWLELIADSKQLSHDAREKLYPLILKWALDFQIGIASVAEIDDINIFHASHLAMVRAVEGLAVPPDHILVDGKFLPKEFEGKTTTAIIKGDTKSLSIACASIIAKVWRDRRMVEFESKYPGYGLSQHKGYPTPAHKAALRKLGITPIHRTSFEPVNQVLQ